MPYIPDDDKRARIDDWLSYAPALEIGELNYVFTKLGLSWLGLFPRYKDYGAIIGELDCAKMELYRRRVAPYEDTKADENGDVYLPPKRDKVLDEARRLSR